MDAHKLAKKYGQAHDAMRSIDGLQPAEAFDELLNYLEARTAVTCQGGDSAAGTDTATRIWHAGQDQAVGLRLSPDATAAVHKVLGDVDFESLTADIRATAFRKFLSPDVRKGLGIFLTPDAVAEMAVRVLGAGSGRVMLDPACGSGTFLLHAAQAAESSGSAAPQLHGVDKSARMVSIARLNLGVTEDSGFESMVADSLSAAFEVDGLMAETADFIATNPPFGVEIDSSAPWLAKYRVPQTLAPGRSIPSEALFLELGLRLLKPGGTMAIVLPRGVLTNRGLVETRRMLGEMGSVYAVVDLPTETFASTGTMTRTCVLFVRRYSDSSEAKTDSSIRYCSVVNVGFDMTGRHRSGGQLEDLSAQLTEADADVQGDNPCSTLRLVASGESFSLLHEVILESNHSSLLETDSVPLGELCELISSGTTPARSRYVEVPGLFILKVGNLTGQGLSWVPRDRNFCAPGKKPRLVQRGDILLTAAAHATKYIAKKVDIVSDIPDAVGGRATWVAEAVLVRPNTQLVSAYRLLAFLRLPGTQEAIRSMATGQTAHLRAGDLATLPVPVSVLAGGLDSLALLLEQESGLSDDLNRVAIELAQLTKELGNAPM